MRYPRAPGSRGALHVNPGTESNLLTNHGLLSTQEIPRQEKERKEKWENPVQTDIINRPMDTLKAYTEAQYPAVRQCCSQNILDLIMSNLFAF